MTKKLKEAMEAPVLEANVHMGDYEHEYYATREMALNAQMPELEGMPCAGPVEQIWEDHHVVLARHHAILKAEVERLTEREKVLTEGIDDALHQLDHVLGDTDPVIDDDWTEEEIRDEYPLLWIFRKLQRALNGGE